MNFNDFHRFAASLTHEVIITTPVAQREMANRRRAKM